ncbi:MAG: hypothetical protein IJM27_02775 [Eubacterium sp.]|nr:hypothetical protein [Eubacterium sp.]
MSDQNRRDAADRLMDAITDLGDDMILAADEQKVKKAGKSPRARWVMIGISAAAVLLAGIISLGVFLGRRGKEERPPVDVSTAAGTEAGITEAGTEAGITEAGTEAGITGAVTQSVTEAVTECLTEAGTQSATEEGTEFSTEAGTPETVIHREVEAKTESYESLAEMEKDADVILRAVRLDQEEPVWNGSSGYTLSQVKISKIYEDKTGSLPLDDVIKVMENEVYDVASNTVFHVAGYNMMVVGDEYLLFLKKDKLPDGTEYYVACGVNYGTISTTTDGREISPKYPNGVDMLDISIYKDIWKDALNKYR